MASEKGFNKDAAFQEALNRARQLAAKMSQGAGGAGGGGSVMSPPPLAPVKRPFDEDFPQPDKKRIAALNDPFGAQLAALKQQSNMNPSLGNLPPGPGLTLNKPGNQPYLNGTIINGEKILDMMIPGTKVGYVIGKGGEMIRNLQERAGVKMTVFQESAEATTAEKQLRITGVPDKVDYAKQLVIDLLTEKEIENIRLKTGGRDKNSNTNDYGTSRSGYIEIPVPPQFIGLVIGKGGESIRRIQQETQTKVQFDTHKSDAKGNKICQISGPPDAIDRATAMIRDIIDNANGRGGNSKSKDGDEFRLPVPAHRTGAVIGRGGETIRAIKQQCGCDVELEKNTKGGNPDEKIFIIRGPPERISYAQQLIMERVNGTSSNDSSMHGGGGGGGGMNYNDLQQQWSNYWQNDNSQSSDEAKGQDPNAAAWAAYYAYYAQQTPQSVPVSNSGSENQSSNNQQPQPNAADGSQNSDYSKQWADYYRAYGMFKEAEMIEQFSKNPSSNNSNENNQPPIPTTTDSGVSTQAVAYPGYNYNTNYNAHAPPHSK